LSNKSKSQINIKYYSRIILILIADALSGMAAHLLSLLVQFDFRVFDILEMYIDNRLFMLLIAILTMIAVYYFFDYITA